MAAYIALRLLVGIFSLVPFGLLYAKANFVAFLLYRVFRYRREVVATNLKNSFPEKEVQELKRIEKGYYKHLADIFLEGVKGMTASLESLQKRYQVTNPELLDQFFESGREVIAVGSHYANWEWGIVAAPSQVKHQLVSYYTPITNKYVDAYMKKKRERFGGMMFPSTDARRPFATETDRLKTYIFGADQSPSNLKSVAWIDFLHQDTACMKGAEFFARAKDYPVIYFNVRRVRRGYYEMDLQLIESNPKDIQDEDITREYMRILEETIQDRPADYLWSHRRWKHRREKMQA